MGGGGTSDTRIPKRRVLNLYTYFDYFCFVQSDGEYRLLKKKEKNNESYMARKGLVSVASWLLCHSTGNEHPKKKEEEEERNCWCVCVCRTHARHAVMTAV